MDIEALDNTSRLRLAIDRMMAGLCTCLPGIIQSFDPETQLADVKSAILRRSVLDDVPSFVEMPLIVNAPVYFPSCKGNGFSLTFPLSEGDNCILVFSQAALDNWLELGGMQPPEIEIGGRHHHFTDAIVIPGINPAPEAITDFQTDCIELRNTDRSSRFTLKDNSLEMVLGNATLALDSEGNGSFTGSGFTFNAPVTFTQGAEVNGGTLVGPLSIDLLTHKHADAQGGVTGVPQ